MNDGPPEELTQELMETRSPRQELEAIRGQVWTTNELQRDFEVLGFGGGRCVVRRRSDRVRGSLDFGYMPRYYYGFVVAD